MRQIRSRHARVALLVLVMATAPAHAYFDYFLNGTVIGTLRKDEVPQYIHLYKDALANVPDGGTVPVQFPAVDRRPAITGTLTLERSRMEQGHKCRRVRSDLAQAGRKERWAGWFCQTPDGDWKRQTAKR
ncbi:hypothetical protein LMG31506_00024 [Cupriavidus yeoncheonensis]|uniref:Surface antigen domain-containing protein n=1 Tax=Cupriavidus yeoncheonensis TaxID=1462994 RepID=A0A916IQ63_9BURK|nr:hypothetical protein [Cupriavidus yeoncheonensis]CAG2126539.1 hypothetical protein LMG31506_00024 [Cupriavidus yeoncheonensis]